MKFISLSSMFSNLILSPSAKVRELNLKTVIWIFINLWISLLQDGNASHNYIMFHTFVYAVKAFAFFVAVYFTAAMSDSPYNTGDTNPFIFGNVKSNIGGGYDHTTGTVLAVFYIIELFFFSHHFRILPVITSHPQQFKGIWCCHTCAFLALRLHNVCPAYEIAYTLSIRCQYGRRTQ